MARYKVGTILRRKHKTTIPNSDSGTTGSASDAKASVGGISSDKDPTWDLDGFELQIWNNPNNVYICDPADGKMTEMIEYCHDQNLKLFSYDNTDVSDCSGQWDTIARFSFTNSEDALIFKLRFK